MNSQDKHDRPLFTSRLSPWIDQEETDNSSARRLHVLDSLKNHPIPSKNGRPLSTVRVVNDTVYENLYRIGDYDRSIESTRIAFTKTWGQAQLDTPHSGGKDVAAAKHLKLYCPECGGLMLPGQWRFVHATPTLNCTYGGELQTQRKPGAAAPTLARNIMLEQLADAVEGCGYDSVRIDCGITLPRRKKIPARTRYPAVQGREGAEVHVYDLFTTPKSMLDYFGRYRFFNATRNPAAVISALGTVEDFFDFNERIYRELDVMGSVFAAVPEGLEVQIKPPKKEYRGSPMARSWTIMRAITQKTLGIRAGVFALRPDTEAKRTSVMGRPHWVLVWDGKLFHLETPPIEMFRVVSLEKDLTLTRYDSAIPAGRYLMPDPRGWDWDRLPHGVAKWTPTSAYNPSAGGGGAHSLVQVVKTPKKLAEKRTEKPGPSLPHAPMADFKRYDPPELADGQFTAYRAPLITQEMLDKVRIDNAED